MSGGRYEKNRGRGEKNRRRDKRSSVQEKSWQMHSQREPGKRKKSGCNNASEIAITAGGGTK